MRLTLARPLVVAAAVALLVTGCGDDADTETLPPLEPEVTFEPDPPEPEVTFEPEEPADPPPQAPIGTEETDCPDTHPQHVELFGSDLRAQLNLMGVTACSDGAGSLWLKNGAKVPWVVARPVVTELPGTWDPKTLLFRDSVRPPAGGGLFIEPGQDWTFPGHPEDLLLRVDAGATAAWQLVTATDNVASGKVKDGIATIAVGRSAKRGAVVQCGRAAYDAGKMYAESEQQSAQAPFVFVLESIGLGQQVGACGTALDQLRRTEPPEQVLVTSDELADQLRRPQVTAPLDNSIAWLKICAGLPRC